MEALTTTAKLVIMLLPKQKGIIVSLGVNEFHNPPHGIGQLIYQVFPSSKFVPISLSPHVQKETFLSNLSIKKYFFFSPSSYYGLSYKKLQILQEK